MARDGGHARGLGSDADAGARLRVRVPVGHVHRAREAAPSEGCAAAPARGRRRRVDVAVTHALFAGDAVQHLRKAGVTDLWSTDCIAHPSNAVFMADALAGALDSLG